MADIKAMTEELIGVTVNYYCPLQIHMTDEEYGDWLEVDNCYGIANEDVIRELVKHEQDCDLHNMADYFNGSAGAKAKLISADWDVQEVGGELYGVIRTGLRAPFSPEEEQEWIDELIGQAADALEKVWNSVKSKPMTGISMYLSGTAARITLWKTKRISDSECPMITASRNSRLEECERWLYYFLRLP